MEGLKKCPKCGMYMVPFLERCFGGCNTVWVCGCGYNSRKIKITYDNKLD